MSEVCLFIVFGSAKRREVNMAGQVSIQRKSRFGEHSSLGGIGIAFGAFIAAFFGAIPREAIGGMVQLRTGMADHWSRRDCRAGTAAPDWQ